MDCKTEGIDYAETGYFSRLILDYLQETEALRSFYEYSPNHPDYGKIIENRRKFPTNRSLLVGELRNLYKNIPSDKAVKQNIQQLEKENTFTVCTAHQPNLFTGYLYFVYKILHAIKLAALLKKQYPQYHFVPVFYMGSEDNDLEELGTVHVNGQTYRWETDQSGAVGRMRPEGIAALIEEVCGELGPTDYVTEIKEILEKTYLDHDDIQTATLYLANALFGRYGLVVINADSPAFKRAVLPMMKEELFEQQSFSIVNQTGKQLSKHYHVQATPREINLFYLKDQLRERIVQKEDKWQVLNTGISFDREQLEKELNEHPERFSPNVILRGILQESILPNIAFIGGGGELAYWMELKDLFRHFSVPFPLLLLRHSVLWVDDKSFRRLQKIGLAPRDLFRDTEELISEYVRENTREELVLKEEYKEIEKLFATLEKKARNIDVTLKASVGAEETKALRSIGKLEHKFLRAEKNKFSWQTELIRNVKSRLFPMNGLQERVENLLPFYGVYGREFIDAVYKGLDPAKNKFTIIREKCFPQL